MAYGINLSDYDGIDGDCNDTECSIAASWGKTGMIEVRICDVETLKKCEIFR